MVQTELDIQFINKLQTEINTIKADIGYWKKQHERAIEREEALKQEVQQLKARIKYLEHQLYGKKSEKSKQNNKNTNPDKNKPKRGNKPGTPGNLRRDRSDLETYTEVYDFNKGETVCPYCGLPYIEMNITDDSEIIEIQEVKAYRRKIKKKKYRQGCKCENAKGIITAPGPVNLMPNIRYGNSVWIHIIIQKYYHQIPINRTLKALELNGFSIPPGTVGDGLKRIAPLFEPIYQALEEKMKEAKWWQADETRWRVFQTTETKQTYNWYLWVFISSFSVVHVVDPTRSARVIHEHLGTVIEGILLVDRYSAYKSFAKNKKGIMLAFCWSHAKRDFDEAGKKYTVIKAWADEWLKEISELFHQNNLRVQYPVGSFEFKKEDKILRGKINHIQNTIDKQLEQIRLHHEQKHVLKSMKNHWEGLTVFVDHSYIPMDNNKSERTIRNSVVGRKNYFGSVTEWSARFTAVMFSIFETLNQWNINQVQWLSDYFRACGLAGGVAPDDVTPYLPWEIKKKTEKVYTYCGKDFTESDIEIINKIIGEDTKRSRSAIARKVCETLEWYQPNGQLKLRNTAIVLNRMEQDGLIELPPVSVYSTSRKARSIIHTSNTDPKPDIIGSVNSLPVLKIKIVSSKQEQELWNEYIDRYHYLGYNSLPGTSLKYFFYSGEDPVALMGFSSSAWRVESRDWYIGWNDEQRKKNLNLVINQARFLILPWVNSKNLASKTLSMIEKCLGDDWENKYKYRPVVIETFVEKKRFSGACYKAANWDYVGSTKGRGKKDIKKERKLPVKYIFMRPLQKNFRKVLCNIDSS